VSLTPISNSSSAAYGVRVFCSRFLDSSRHKPCLTHFPICRRLRYRLGIPTPCGDYTVPRFSVATSLPQRCVLDSLHHNRHRYDLRNNCGHVALWWPVESVATGVQNRDSYIACGIFCNADPREYRVLEDVSTTKKTDVEEEGGTDRVIAVDGVIYRGLDGQGRGWLTLSTIFRLIECLLIQCICQL
jgi:hypothetical protein